MSAHAVTLQGRLVCICADAFTAKIEAKKTPGSKVEPAGSTLRALQDSGITQFPWYPNAADRPKGAA